MGNKCANLWIKLLLVEDSSLALQLLPFRWWQPLQELKRGVFSVFRSQADEVSPWSHNLATLRRLS
jgi:hypothetical protein